MLFNQEIVIKRMVAREKAMNRQKLLVDSIVITLLSLMLIVPYFYGQLKSGITGFHIITWVLSLIICEIGIRKRNVALTLVALLQLAIVMIRMMTF